MLGFCHVSLTSQIAKSRANCAPAVSSQVYCTFTELVITKFEDRK